MKMMVFYDEQQSLNKTKTFSPLRKIDFLMQSRSNDFGICITQISFNSLLVSTKKKKIG
jgi:hypothetical protein